MKDGALKLELLRNSSRRNILYAFVSDGEVKYFGKTVQSLAKRMAAYVGLSETQRTNVRNHKNLMVPLGGGNAVEIFALPDNGLLHYGQFHLNLAAALEDDISRVLEPEWNGGNVDDGLNLPRPALNLETDSDVLTQEQLTPTFAFVRRPTYCERGFFNVPSGAQQKLGADGEKFELFLGNDSQPILGTINRRANATGTPRSSGGAALRNWFQRSVAKSSVSVDVMTPTSLRLHLPL